MKTPDITKNFNPDLERRFLTIFWICVLIALTVIFITLFITSAKASSGEWSSIYSKNVHTNQSISLDNITITDLQFSSPVTAHTDSNGKLINDYLVTPTIYFNTTINGTTIPLVLGEGSIYENNKTQIRITASDFTAPDSTLWEYASYNPSATLSIYCWTYELPSLRIILVPQYSSIEYGKYDSILLKSDIVNTGKFPVYAEVSPDFGTLSSLSNSTKRKIFLDSGSSETMDWTIDIPQAYRNHSLTVTATIKEVPIYYPDGTYKNITLSFSSSTEIQITIPSPDINIYKTIPSRLYTCINTSATLVVSNEGIFDIDNVVVTDSIPGTFYAANNNLIWNIPIIKSGTQVTLYERMTPTQPGTYTTSAAELSYSISGGRYSNTSSKVKTQVISTGKDCSFASTQVMNVNPEPIAVSAPVATVTPKIHPPKTTATVPRKVPQNTPTVSLPGFEFPFVIIALLIAHKLRR